MVVAWVVWLRSVIWGRLRVAVQTGSHRRWFDQFLYLHMLFKRDRINPRTVGGENVPPLLILYLISPKLKQIGIDTKLVIPLRAISRIVSKIRVQVIIGQP